MTVTVRWASPADAADLARILCEMAVHYRQPLPAEDRAVAAAHAWLSSESPAYPHFAVAWRAGAVAGLASVAIAHPGIDLQRLMFLKDLFVRETFRSNGVGHSLLEFLAGHCLAEGIGRIDLTTEGWNDALGFYEKRGAVRHDQKIFLRFDTDALRRLAAR